jgi:hypothetical protein
MLKEEIYKIASNPTKANTRTEIKFNDNSKVVGYFDNNPKGGELYNQNKWNFVKIPKDENNSNGVIYDGNDFKSISIIQIF